jgi:PncC family amidohydrolase
MNTKRLHKALIEQGKTLVFAESCTGGFLSHQITQNAGASRYFLGSFVVYSNDLKNKILQVPKSFLLEYGAVSAQVAVSMVKGALAVSGADIGIAVTGIAGPEGGSCEKPVGTVWMAIGEKGCEPEVGMKIFLGDRKDIIVGTSSYLLETLYKKIQKGVPCFSEL